MDAELMAATAMAKGLRAGATLGADKAYDAKGFVKTLRALRVTPRVFQHLNRNGRSAIDGRSQRYKEIGIRMAMGAQPWQVSAGSLRHAAVLATVGVGLGVLIAWASGPLIEGMLFRVDARDPAIFMAVATILIMTSLAASYVPARQW